MINLDAVVSDADTLEPLPPSAARLVGLVGTEGWDIDEVERIVCLDPALTGRLLRIANSASSGAQVDITTVHEATMRMGAGALVAAAVGSGVSGVFKQPLEVYEAAAGELWRHSVAAALAVEAMPSVVRVRPSPASFTAALLHDVGKLVLCSHLCTDALKFLDRAHDEAGLLSAAAESEILEVNHAELGGLVAQHWKLPEEIMLGIAHHHDPDVVQGESLRHTARVVCLAEHVARIVVPGLGEYPPEEGENADVLDALGVDAGGVAALVERVSERLSEALSAYS